jgi:hypothetical protein
VQKPVDQTISISGQSGSDGYSGTDGSPGTSGINGVMGGCSGNGGHGTNGGDGSDGRNGGSGHHGTNAQHALIWLNGTVENVNMQMRTFQTLNNPYQYSTGIEWNQAQFLSDIDYNFQLNRSNGIILVKAVKTELILTLRVLLAKTEVMVKEAGTVGAVVTEVMVARRETEQMQVRVVTFT